MKTFSFDPSGWIKNNRNEYGEQYGLLNWVSENKSRASEEQRQNILRQLNDQIQYGFKDTKIDTQHLSQGCILCGQGQWSCLFINGRCNCQCFYCPTVQDDIGLPTTNHLTFTEPQQYIDYIERFQIKGVSLSGGEPFLTFDRSLEYAQAIQNKFGDKIYLWMYTNGTLVTKDKLLQLRDAGMDEIRFDIAATDYDLKAAQSAVPLIPTVTVEIPAIPEDFLLLKEKIKEMADIGIKHLNLHQLRLTVFNFEKLVNRGYTFLHGERVTVLESELTALEALLFTKKNKINLPINYCSFYYKNCFQHSAVRRRSAEIIKKSFEDITEKGYIRALRLTATSDIIKNYAHSFEQNNINPELWKILSNQTQLQFSIQCGSVIPTQPAQISVTYYETILKDHVTYQNMFKEIKLAHKSIFAECWKASKEIVLSKDDLAIIKNSQSHPSDMEHLSQEISHFETILPGWKPYC